MKQEIINKYTDQILYNKLIEFGVKEKYCKEITNNIKEQIYAVLHHWNDISFRKALLIIGMEEGKFYEPEADLDIKSFVVVAIRNSLLEIILSDESKIMELDKPLLEKSVKVITSGAIEYFKNIDFKELGKAVEKEGIKDIYQEIAKNYPMAFEALRQLGNCIGNKVIYPKIEVKSKMKISDLNMSYEKNETNNSTNKRFLKEVQSGINENFTNDLLEYINDILENEEVKVFYADCFKMITRNFEKLLKIIEILLENDRIILTSNYLIMNSYIGKRMEIYRAAHNTKDMNDKLNDIDFLSGLSKTHRNILKEYIKYIRNKKIKDELEIL